MPKINKTRAVSLANEMIFAQDSEENTLLTSLRNEARGLICENPQMKHYLTVVALGQIVSKMDMLCDIHEQKNQPNLIQ